MIEETAAGIVGELVELDFSNPAGTLLAILVPHGTRWSSGKYLLIPCVPSPPVEPEVTE